MQEEKVFDRQVANALANENVEMTVNKNKTMTKQEKNNDGMGNG